MESPWVYAKDHTMADAGIDLTVNEGKGSAVTAQTVGNGSDDCGIVDAGTWLTLASKGIAAKAVLSVYAQNTLAVLSPAGSPIASPADLEGKGLAITAGDGPSTLLPVLMKLNDVDAKKVELVNMQPGPKLTSLATGKVDGVVTNSVVAPGLAAKGVETKALMYWDYGVHTPGFYMVCSDKFLAKKDVATDFVHAAQKTLEAALEHPDAVAKSFSEQDKYNDDLAVAELKSVLGSMPSSDASAPLGSISEETLATALKILTDVGQIKDPKSFDDYATNDFLDEGVKRPN
ncbi:ABC transporter substrate-binding protein [Nocardioides sp. AN3]